MASLERNEDLPCNPIVALRESRVSDKAISIGGFVFKFVVDPFSDAGVMPTSRAVDATGNDFSCTKCENWLEM